MREKCLRKMDWIKESENRGRETSEKEERVRKGSCFKGSYFKGLCLNGKYLNRSYFSRLYFSGSCFWRIEKEVENIFKENALSPGKFEADGIL